MNINETCYVCVIEREGIGECRLCYDTKSCRQCVAAKYTPYLPILFRMYDDACDALLKHTSFKGWTIQKVKLTDSI